MTRISTYLFTISLNNNGLTFLTERHRLADWILKKTQFFVICKKHLTSKDIHSLKMKKRNNTFYANGT